jgi:6,7-dimethyl-8-ribityllumazine synthase
MSEKIRLPIFDGHNDSIQMMYVPGAIERPFLAKQIPGI